MRKDIYHYYFNYDKSNIEVVKEQYEEHDRKYNSIKLYVKGERLWKTVSKFDIGVAINGKYVLLYERDDEKARQIFLDYLFKDITKQSNRLSRFIDKYNMFATLEMTEEN